MIRAVYMTDSAWKTNMNDFGVVRNHYKNAEVIIQIKDSKACVALPANAAQRSAGAGKFDASYEFDEWTGGLAVPCP